MNKEKLARVVFEPAELTSPILAVSLYLCSGGRQSEVIKPGITG